VVIVDTTIWIDLLNGRQNPHTEWLARAIPRQRLGLLDVILCEVLQGTKSELRFNEARAALLSFEVFSTGGVELAMTAARHYRALRAHGRAVRATIDSWIATYCLMHGHELLHHDRDFDHFEELLGLRVVHP
jgi:predicted nucleic acid-binding protein